VVGEFESMLRRAKLKALSEISKERFLTDAEFKKFKELGRTELGVE